MDALLTLVIALIAGIIIYYIDLKKGRRWNTGWYNLTHEHRSPTLLDKGMIHLQPFTRKLFFAILLSAIFTAIAVAIGGAHALFDLIMGGVAVIGLMIGFYAGVLLFKGRHWNMEPVREVLEKVDRMEARAHGRESATPDRVEPPATSSPPAESREEQKPDWRAGIKKFTDKK